MVDKIYGIVYKATNKINGKFYIGQTVKSLNKRISNHINFALNIKDGLYFHKAIRKYGKENFKWEIIAECGSLRELNRVEVEMIEKYNTFGNGYNLTKGGEGKVGCKHTDEARAKISKSMKGKNHPLYGKQHTEESKMKMSRSRKGEKGFWYGKHLTKEIREKISRANKGKLVGRKHPLARKYIITTLKGEKISIYGLREFCRNYKKEKLDHTCLVRVAQKKLKQHKGYKCEYWKGENYE